MKNFLQLCMVVLVLTFSTDASAQAWLKKLGNAAEKAKSKIEQKTESKKNDLDKTGLGLGTVLDNASEIAREKTDQLKSNMTNKPDVLATKREMPKFTPGETLPDGATYYRQILAVMNEAPSKDSIAAFWADTTGLYLPGAKCVREFRDKLLSIKADYDKHNDEILAKATDEYPEIAVMIASDAVNNISAGLGVLKQDGLNKFNDARGYALGTAQAQLNNATAQLANIEDAMNRAVKLGEHFGEDITTEEGQRNVEQKMNALTQAEREALLKELGYTPVAGGVEEVEAPKGPEFTLTDDESAVMDAKLDVTALMDWQKTSIVRGQWNFDSDEFMTKWQEGFDALYSKSLEDCDNAIGACYNSRGDFAAGQENIAREKIGRMKHLQYEYVKNTIGNRRYESLMEFCDKCHDVLPYDVLSHRKRIVYEKIRLQCNKKYSQEAMDLISQIEFNHGIDMLSAVLEFIDSKPLPSTHSHWMTIDFYDPASYKKDYIGK
ncbi:MAG: hypothetical protein MJZ27_02605 [Bacteroidales bacterium]|nr:hypothetical protein [Bacteroidales bacterium]